MLFGSFLAVLAILNFIIQSIFLYLYMPPNNQSINQKIINKQTPWPPLEKKPSSAPAKEELLLLLKEEHKAGSSNEIVAKC